ncbi:MAG: NUDIX domain-containing protein [Sphingomonadaceae bacterium]|uniref:A/G-specific adenine glycosylase n=1 Tax=Thermaurantiacus sp. TaxID=2820283 RepID=UPI00298F3376|nr:NUDIX domain-containing protein [Thermaurantiacus sp.]MCS6985881.1 NUDIX domain-containing protein [Sphingomonadaceae bacterium]MDW8413850.1 NUDIX domain-containing protein [Thermaurantiacus sp.]
MPVEPARLPIVLAADPGRRLLAWYDRQGRALPWRAPAGGPAPDPYRVWLSEVMLQQTTVATVRGRFEGFVARWPDVFALARADEADVMAAWAGLGYYARARSLVACAREVARRGGFPRTAEELGRLPGIGPYTAAAVAAIAFGQPVVPVDANVARVAARVFAIDEPVHRLAAVARTKLSPWVPPDRPGDFAQALMDLGATVCRPRVPACAACPWAADCRALAQGQVAQLPRPRSRPSRRQARGMAWWIEWNGRVALERRPPSGLLGGMPGLPGTNWGGRVPSSLPFPGLWRYAAQPVRHRFTHLDLELSVAAVRLSAPPPFDPGWAWHPIDALPGLPTLYVRAAAVARALLAAP